MIGRRFDRWTVVAFADQDDRCRRRWRCSCDCGTERAVWEQLLTSGRSRSCGCLQRERASANIKHGCARHNGRRSEHRIWCQMRQRCASPKDKRFHDYGGRGIRVCPRWESFECFLEDVGQRPSGEHSLDRIDNDGNYEPGNVRWATRSEQQRNRRNSIRLAFRGESLLLVEWAERLGVKYTTLETRLRRGWSVERTLSKVVS